LILPWRSRQLFYSRRIWHDQKVSATRTPVRSPGLSGPLLAFGALTLVSVIWGSSYPFTKILFRDMTAWQFLALRFTVAAVVMAAVFWRPVLRLPRRVLLQGVLLGVMFGVAQILQTVGLAHTAATVSGFITGLYVVFTPLCAAVLLRTRVGVRVWVASTMAIIGLGILALQGVSLGLGEWLTLGSALIYALHILALGAWSRAREALGLSVVQVVVVAAVCVIAAAPGGYATPGSSGGWLILIYLAVVSGGIAMLVQTWAQSQMSASRAAIVMSTEPVWAALLAITMIGEPLTWRVVIGGALMLSAMFVVESGGRSATDPAGVEDLPKLAG
jgi:drug/metabolite transporter (DMT)-like permease